MKTVYTDEKTLTARSLFDGHEDSLHG